MHKNRMWTLTFGCEHEVDIKPLGDSQVASTNRYGGITLPQPSKIGEQKAGSLNR